MGSLPKSSLSTTRRLWKWVVILLEWDREGYSHADHAKEELPYCYVKTQVEEQRPGIHSVWQVVRQHNRRGEYFASHCISMHCVKEEHTAINMNLHYLDNGTVMLNFIYQIELFFLPVGFALKILNKSSWERGFGHGCVYKTEVVDLAEKKGEDNLVFGVKPGDPKVMDKLDTVGLPPIGAVLQYGDPFYSYINTGQSFVNF